MRKMWRFGLICWLGFSIAASHADILEDKVNEINANQSQDVVVLRDNKQTEAARKERAGDVIMQAMGLIGVTYKFGGSNPNQGLDCSGFIQYIFKRSMRVNLPRTAAMMAKEGQAVTRENLRSGDLVFFNTRGFANSHVGLYIGNNKFIHAPRTGKNVEVVNLESKYWSARYNGARRIDSNTRAAPFVAKEKPTPQQKIVVSERAEETRVVSKGKKSQLSAVEQKESLKGKGGKGNKKETVSKSKDKNDKQKDTAKKSKSVEKEQKSSGKNKKNQQVKTDERSDKTTKVKKSNESVKKAGSNKSKPSESKGKKK